MVLLVNWGERRDVFPRKQKLQYLDKQFFVLGGSKNGLEGGVEQQTCVVSGVVFCKWL